ncbi:MAG: hypothetical protein GF308_05885 [Candidatus Heimdallarchaeota archaeon]|nr:hypothetical protein [Candidatus Heimdallarchaeota archaeon]
MSEVFDILKRHMLVDGYEIIFDLEKSTPFYIVDKSSTPFFFPFRFLLPR